MEMECEIKTEPFEPEDVDNLVKNENVFHCEECQEEFTEEIVLSVHKSLHDPAKVCPICNKQYSNHDKGMTMFFAHVNKHISSVLRCKHCPEVFFNHKDFNLHLSAKHQHPAERKYPCDTCVKGFKTKKELTIHTRVHTNERPYKCEVCPKAFKQASSLATHKKTHCEEKLTYNCSICGGFFATPSTVRRHMRNIHTKGKALTCNMCEESFQFKDALLKHQRETHSDILLMCQICPCFFMKVSNYRRHVRRIHGESKLSEIHTQEVRTKLHNQIKEKEETNKLPTCEICFRTFTETWKLNKHIREVHYQNKSHPCPSCPQAFSAKKTLEKHHRRDHLDAGLIICKLCDSVYTQRDSLSKHIRKAHQGRLISCPKQHCKKKFCTQNDLEKHKQEVHSRDTQTKACPLCGLVFPHNSKYYRHKQSHTSFSCNLCGKKIEGKYGMEHEMEHLQMDLEEYEKCMRSGVFPCKTCGYVEEKGLSRIMKHLETHNNNMKHRKLRSSKTVMAKKKPLECSICNKKFSLKFEFFRHYKTHNYVKCYICDDCGTTRLTLRSIRKHINLSDKCKTQNFCLRLITREHYLKQVSNDGTVHPHEYPCDSCKKVFSSRKKLTVHINDDHMHKYVFKCKNCNAPFLAFWNWRKHIQMQICRQSKEDMEKKDLNDFNCIFCSATHNSLQDLTKHMEKHLVSGNSHFKFKQTRPYFRKRLNDNSLKCVKCLREFETARDMWIHTKKVHLYPNKNKHRRVGEVLVKGQPARNEDIVNTEIKLDPETNSVYFIKEEKR